MQTAPVLKRPTSARTATAQKNVQPAGDLLRPSAPTAPTGGAPPTFLTSTCAGYAHQSLQPQPQPPLPPPPLTHNQSVPLPDDHHKEAHPVSHSNNLRQSNPLIKQQRHPPPLLPPQRKRTHYHKKSTNIPTHHPLHILALQLPHHHNPKPDPNHLKHHQIPPQTLPLTPQSLHHHQ